MRSRHVCDYFDTSNTNRENLVLKYDLVILMQNYARRLQLFTTTDIIRDLKNSKREKEREREKGEEEKKGKKLSKTGKFGCVFFVCLLLFCFVFVCLFVVCVCVGGGGGGHISCNFVVLR